jgi:hypothetical protein
MSSYAIRRGVPRPSLRAAGRQGIAGLLVAVVAGGLTLYAAHRASLTAVAAVIVVAGSLWCATTRRPQVALAVLMLYLGLLDGYLKLATGSNLVTFVRDVLLYALVVGLLVRATIQGRRLPLPPLSGWVIAFVVLVLIELPNPRAGTLVHSLAGARQHLEFVPLFFLTYAFVRTTRALRMFVILLAVIAAVNGVVGWVQFNESAAQFASWGPGYSQRILGTGSFSASGRSFQNNLKGGGSRPFGLGSDSGDGGLFGAFAFCGIIALASFSTRSRYRAFAVLMALGAALAIITSQDRGVIVSSVIIVLVFTLLTATSRSRLTSLAGLALAGIAAFFVIHGVVSSATSNSLRYHGLNPSSLLTTTNKARGKSISQIPHNLVAYPFGAGLGTAGPAAAAAPGASQLTLSSPPDTETEFSFLTVETGIAGMLVFTGFTITLLVLGVRRCRDEPDPEARMLLAAVVAPLAGILALFFASALSPSVPPGPYIWAIGGVLSYWLVTLPANRRRGAITARAQPPRVLRTASATASPN